MKINILYQRDLAYIHHTGFGDFSRQAGPELLKILERAKVRGGTLIDLGCGSGIWAARAQRAGFEVVGVDCSPAMVRLARVVAPKARLELDSLYDFPIPPCAAVTALGEGLNYLLPYRRSAPPPSRLFEKIAKALRPGGLLIFDVMVTGGTPIRARSWQMGPDWAVLVEASEFPHKRRLSRRNIIFRQSNGRWRRHEETHWIRLFEPDRLVGWLRGCGFEVRVMSRYGRVPLLPRRLAFIARKL